MGGVDILRNTMTRHFLSRNVYWDVLLVRSKWMSFHTYILVGWRYVPFEKRSLHSLPAGHPIVEARTSRARVDLLGKFAPRNVTSSKKSPLFFCQQCFRDGHLKTYQHLRKLRYITISYNLFLTAKKLDNL